MDRTVVIEGGDELLAQRKRRLALSRSHEAATAVAQ
jgi:hypothetical protein